MNVQKDISLKAYNTFGIDARAKYFCEINSLEDLRQALRTKEYPDKFIISGGSNMLITRNIDVLVLHINLKGIEMVSEDEDHVILKVMAGENWHDMVLWTLAQGFGGLENMSLIPGNTGTAPIQNIGAYGVELKDTFVSCQAMKIEDQTLQEFSKADCQFGYRDSYFKNAGRGKYIIVSVNFKLTKKNHRLNTSYGSIEQELIEKGIINPGIKDISDAVVAIRKSKLPDPKELGNSGSFFKNPVLSAKKFSNFLEQYPKAPYYEVAEDAIKVPAGWLIEQCGFKGKRFGNVGVHVKQALVLVNYGGGTGQEVLGLADKIIHAVQEKFGIEITPEVNIIK